MISQITTMNQDFGSPVEMLSAQAFPSIENSSMTSQIATTTKEAGSPLEILSAQATALLSSTTLPSMVSFLLLSINSNNFLRISLFFLPLERNA